MKEVFVESIFSRLIKGCVYANLNLTRSFCRGCNWEDQCRSCPFKGEREDRRKNGNGDSNK